MFNGTKVSRSIIPGRDERTPEAVAVVNKKAEGQVPPNSNVGSGKALLLFPPPLSAFNSETNFPQEGQETAFPGYLDYIAKRSEAENRGLIKGCPSGFVTGHCDDGHRFAKELYCGREWCPTCNGKWEKGKAMLPSHARRFVRWLPKLQQIESLGYFVFTIPMEKRPEYRSQESLSKLGHDVRLLLKSSGFARGVCRYHWFGDTPGKWNPHLNILVDGGLIGRKQLTTIKRAYAELLGVRMAVLEYHYLTTPGQKIHTLTYVTRATFLDAEWDVPMALELRGFRNQLWWGSGLWNDATVWSLNDASASESVDGMTDEQAHSVGALEQGFCPHDGAEIVWETYHRIDALPEMHPVAIGAGYYELPRSIPPPGRLDLSGLVPVPDHDRGLSSILSGLDSSAAVNAERFLEKKKQAHRYAEWIAWKTECGG